MDTLKPIFEFLKELGAFIGVVVSLCGVIAGLIKPIRKRIITWIRRIVSTDEQNKEIQYLANVVNNFVVEQKKHNESINRRLEEFSTQNLQLKEADYYTLGNVIREVYHENKSEHKLSEREYELCGKVYKLYHDEWKQNGPIEAMWNEMRTWEKVFD